MDRNTDAWLARPGSPVAHETWPDKDFPICF